jgi:hypothetical protein
MTNISDYMLCYLILLAKDQATVRIPYINYDYISICPPIYSATMHLDSAVLTLRNTLEHQHFKTYWNSLL